MNFKKALFVACLAGLMVVGCGKKDEAKGGDKAAAGDKAGKKEGAAKSGKSNHEKLQGTWTFDVDKMIEADEKMAAMIKEKPEMKANIAKMMEGASITISEKEVVMKGMGKEEKASYTVEKQDGNKITVKSKEEGKDEEETLTFEFIDDDTMKGKEEGKDSDMYLVRKK